jgi:CBS domain-containing protein
MRDDKNPQPVDISDDDIYEAMKDIPGYLDITSGDLKEIYHLAYRHAAERLTRSVKARDIMTRDVVSVKKDTHLQEVAEAMADRRISGVPVLGEDGEVVGVISERDFLTHMGAKDSKTFMEVVAECLKGGGCMAAPMRAQRAGDIMTSPAVTVREETTLLEIINTFKDKAINRVPVVDGEGHLVGIVSRADVMESPFWR